MFWSTAYTVADIIGIATGFVTTAIAVYGWWKLKKYMKKIPRIEAAAGSEDVVLILNILGQEMMESVIKYIENAGESYQGMINGKAIKRHIEFNEKNKDYYPGNAYFSAEYVYTSDKGAHDKEPKGRIVEVKPTPGHNMMPFEKNELAPYMYGFRKVIKDTADVLSGSGVVHLHLFMSTTVPQASIIGYQLRNFQVSLYHRDLKTKQYYYVGNM